MSAEINNPEKQQTAQYLLGKNDFQIIDSENQKYLFLADSLRFFRITNSAIEEYLRLCTTGNINNTFLSKEEITQIGNFLKQEENIEMPESTPDLNYTSLTLNITGKCNMACKYCFADTSIAKSMTFEIAKKAIDNMLAQKEDADEYSIFYFGGEPLLKKTLLRQTSEYAYQEITVKRNKKIKFLINTNATLIDDEVIAIFKQYGFKVTVSLDGPREIHDINRIYSDGKGSYRKPTRNCKLQWIILPVKRKGGNQFFAMN
jgi:uncharacterized protein